MLEWSDLPDDDLPQIQQAQLSGGPIAWTLDARNSDPDMQVYAGDDPLAPPGVVSFCAVTDVKATVDDVAGLFYTPTTADYRAYCQQSAKGSLDAAVLYTLAAPSSSFPRHSIAIKWVAMTLMAGMPARDVVFLECHHDFDMQGGRRGWVRCCKSIEISCCPDLRDSHGLVRGSFHRAGFVCVETDVPGTLRVTYVVQMDVRTRLPRILAAAAVRKWTRRLENMQLCVWGRKLSTETFLPLDKLIPQDTRGRCILCQRKFGAFGAKESCRKCGHVVCRSCSKDWHIVTQGSLHWMRLCFVCTKRKVALSSASLWDRHHNAHMPATLSSRRAISLNHEPGRVYYEQQQPWQSEGSQSSGSRRRRTRPGENQGDDRGSGMEWTGERRRGLSLPPPTGTWQLDVGHVPVNRVMEAIAPPDDMTLVRVSSWLARITDGFCLIDKASVFPGFSVVLPSLSAGVLIAGEVQLPYMTVACKDQLCRIR
ncbi:hypothetical protein DYB26_001708 [Aphanomyces astaci]|uniref:FYVE-type domain-containing protein n=1 Tax=Aphanomyces astaci TaxID=112090 RepID=A0A418G305_APHAT|nr:hypothetical protein DYB26_001708 [Aphanomyces astaci]